MLRLNYILLLFSRSFACFFSILSRFKKQKFTISMKKRHKRTYFFINSRKSTLLVTMIMVVVIVIVVSHNGVTQNEF